MAGYWLAQVATKHRSCPFFPVVQSFVRYASRFVVLSTEQISRLEAVVCDPAQPDTILAALSDAERVRLRCLYSLSLRFELGPALPCW